MVTGSSRYTAEELQALTDAAFAVTSERSLDRVLQKLVDVGRTLVHGRYGALSVVRDDGGIERFLTSGISEEERRRIGHIPEGRGLLAVLLHEGTSLRVADISNDPRSVGFP